MAKRNVTIFAVAALSSISALVASSRYSATIIDAPQVYDTLHETPKNTIDGQDEVTPSSIQQLPAFPNDTETRLIGRMTDGIIEWKTRRDNGWWQCGTHITSEDVIEERALAIAYHTVQAASNEGLNPWGLVGTMANESAFDPCALGTYPRKWAVAHGYLEMQRHSISYPRKDVLSVVRHKRAGESFVKTGFDLGLCQLLSKFYDGPPADLLTVATGISICAKEMATRSRRHDTRRPWAYWPGRKTDWYDRKISILAQRIGAKRDEI